MASSIDPRYSPQTTGNSTQTQGSSTSQHAPPNSGSVGVSHTPSSMQSSAPTTDASSAQRPSCWQEVTTVVTNVFRAICQCFAKLPVIGGFFEGSREASGRRTPLIDQGILQKFRDVFSNNSQALPNEGVVNNLLNEFQAIQDPANKISAFCTVLSSRNSNDEIIRVFLNALPQGTLTDQDILQRFEATFNNTSGHVNPSEETLCFLLSCFRNILQNPIHKMEAFLRVISAPNSSNDIATAFYHGLPEGTLPTEDLNNGRRQASKASLRYQLFIHNDRSSQIGTQDYGLDFGEIVMQRYPRDPLVQEATKGLIDQLRRTPSQAASRSSESIPVRS